MFSPLQLLSSTPEVMCRRRLLFLVAALLVCCRPSLQQDQQYYFSNSAQPSFVPSFQSTPRQQQYEEYFRQAQNPSPFSPFSSQQAAPSGFQQNQRLPNYEIPPSLQPTPFQLPPSSSAPTSHFDTFQSDHFHPSHQETPPQFPQKTYNTKFSNNPPVGPPSNIQPSLSFSGVQEYNNVRHPQTFPNQAPPAQATIKLPQTFLDQITLSPSGFSGGLPQSQRNANNLRLIQGFPDIERPQGLVDQFSPAPQRPRRPQNNFFPPSAAQEVKKPIKFVPEEVFEINTNIDQHLEVDDGNTNDSRTKTNPPTTARSRDQIRKADAALRRKPGTKPQPGSRGNFLTPKNSRQNESQGRGTTNPRNIPSGPVQANYDDYTHDSLPPSGRGRSKTRQEGRYRQSTTQPTQPQTHRIRSNRFTPTTKSSTKARQINIRPTKVPFLPKRVTATSTTEAEQVVDDDYSADFPDYVENEKATFVESSLANTTYDDLHTKYNSQTVSNMSEIEEGQSNATLTVQTGTDTGVNVDGDTTTFISNSVDESSTYQNEENTTMTENISPQEDVSDYIDTDDKMREITSTGQDEVVELSSTDHEDVSTTQEDSSVLIDSTATVLNLEDHFILLPEKDHILPSQDHSISNNTRTFDVLTMNPDHTLVEDDNFKGFVDSVLIDATDRPQLTTMENDDKTEEAGVVTVSVNTSVTMKTSTSKSLIPLMMNGHPIEEAVVSVVTTKSVINNAVVMTSTAQPEQTELDQVLTPHPAMSAVENITSNPTESWFIIASVQTSRSVSGARFLPSSDVKQEERPISLSGKALDEDELANDELDEMASTEDPKLIPETNQDPSDPSINKTVSDEAMPPSLDSGSSTSESVSKTSAASTESIIDKLDRVQSELSSGILTGGFRNGANKLQLEVLTEMSSDKPGDIMPMGRTLNITTSTTTDITPTTTTTYKSPVFIRRFEPHSSRSTAKPKKLMIENLPMDDLSGLLPAGFKPRTPARRTKTSTQSPDSIDMPQGDEPPKPSLPITGFKLRSATGRLQNGKSSNIGASKNKVQVQDTISSLLPPGFKPKEDNGTVSNEKPKELPVALGKIKFETPTSLLPPGYKPPIENGTTEKPKRLEDLFRQIQVDDIASLLPPGYKPPPEEPSTTVKPKAIENLLSVAKPVDINAFLPPGFTLPDSTTEKLASTVLDALLDKVKFQDVLLLLPPGFKPETNTSFTAVPTRPPLPTTAAGSKVVFPSRPEGARKPITRTSTTAKPADAPEVTLPKINKGWPIRATTEFTGWPTSSTTPISIEKLLEAAKTATTTSSPTTTTTTSTTTTTTTTTTPRPTTPGVCKTECDLAATIKLVGGAQWVPELLDHNTQEWQDLANEVQSQLEEVYSKSDQLNQWYKKITIDSFSEGSVLVDYFVELNELGRQVDTMELKRLFHETLTKPQGADGQVVSARHLDELKQSDGEPQNKLQLGAFILDPQYTDFIVLPKQIQPTVGYADESMFLPQWAIAGIVIGLASLLFVIIFGVTVLVNRNKNNKKKQPTPLTEDMLNELNKNHMGGLDNFGAEDLYNMEDVWNDKPYDKPNKKRSSASLHDNSMSNLYDSWRSEWNGYYYNAYYGNSNGGGSSSSGYARRRSDYDTNF